MYNTHLPSRSSVILYPSLKEGGCYGRVLFFTPPPPWVTTLWLKGLGGRTIIFTSYTDDPPYCHEYIVYVMISFSILDALRQVSTKDTVHDLLQFALERPECCYRTCLSVRLLGKRLDDFTELGMIEGLVDGATLELVEGKYEC